jgi:uncharacterized protein (DUF697 family)
MSESAQKVTGSTDKGDAEKASTEHTQEAQAIIRRSVLWALGAGVVPVPIVDVIAVMAVQVKMLNEFSKLYGFSFTEGIAKKLVGTLLTSLGVVTLGSTIGGSLAKLVPVIGTTLGLISVPVLAGAMTHAVGTVFMMHFEAGGTLLDFDPKSMREYFHKEFEKAKHTVTQLHQDHVAGAKQS